MRNIIITILILILSTTVLSQQKEWERFTFRNKVLISDAPDTSFAEGRLYVKGKLAADTGFFKYGLSFGGTSNKKIRWLNNDKMATIVATPSTPLLYTYNTDDGSGNPLIGISNAVRDSSGSSVIIGTNINGAGEFSIFDQNDWWFRYKKSEARFYINTISTLLINSAGMTLSNGYYYGNGSKLTALDGANIQDATVTDVKLNTTTLPHLNTNNTYTRINTFDSTIIINGRLYISSVATFATNPDTAQLKTINYLLEFIDTIRLPSIRFNGENRVITFKRLSNAGDIIIAAVSDEYIQAEEFGFWEEQTWTTTSGYSYITFIGTYEAGYPIWVHLSD